MADDLLDPSFDRHPPGPAMPPVTSYLVCSTPRSGSTLVCEALRSTGRLAVPTEYFNIEATVEPLSRRWGSTDGEAYVCDLYRFRTSPDGTFGTKLHWQQVEEMEQRLALAPVTGPDRCRLPRMLERLFPGARYVHVERRDRIRQAVSYWNADHTRQWSVHRGEEPAPAAAPEYDADGIDTWYDRIDAGEAGWAAFFDRSGIEPIRVVYEDFVRDYALNVVSLARQLGVTLAPDDVAPPRLLVQADERSEATVDRYRADRRHRG